MPLVVNTNIASINAQRNLDTSTNALQGSVARLSSGLRITKASDDAAGLGISETLRAQIRSINQASRNANDGISLLQVADGGAANIGNLLARLRELAAQSASGILGSTERSFLDQEFVALRSEIDRISSVTEFNNVKLLSGSGNDSLSIQIGFRSSSNDTLSLSLNDLTTSALALTSTNVSTSASALTALASIDSAISAVASARATIGSLQNRMMLPSKTWRWRMKTLRLQNHVFEMRTSHSKQPSLRETRFWCKRVRRFWLRPIFCLRTPSRCCSKVFFVGQDADRPAPTAEK